MLTVLCGGFGGARFLPGLVAALGAHQELTCVVNTADDLDYLGLHISPDIDSVCYGLAGEFDEERGWGVAGDTFRCNAALARYGDDWFHVGDTDLALHLKRSALLQQGLSLTEATRILAESRGLSARVLPMTDGPVRTMLDTDAGRLSFQEFVVAREAQPTVHAVSYEGAAGARPSPGVEEALRDAEVVLLAPSNPISSIGPILALAGIREVLQARRGPTVAVSPVVSGQPPGTPPERQRAHVRAALLAASGYAHRAAAVARLYADLVHGFVLDVRDAAEGDDVARLGSRVHLADTLAQDAAGRVALAKEILAFARPLSVSRPHV